MTTKFKNATAIFAVTRRFSLWLCNDRVKFNDPCFFGDSYFDGFKAHGITQIRWLIHRNPHHWVPAFHQTHNRLIQNLSLCI